jgi:hypothetical protein
MPAIGARTTGGSTADRPNVSFPVTSQRIARVNGVRPLTKIAEYGVVERTQGDVNSGRSFCAVDGTA